MRLISWTLQSGSEHYWCCDFYSAYKQSAMKKKIRKFLFIGVANAPRFACRHRECPLLCLKVLGSAADYILLQFSWC
jgi:hypothetical protein